MLLICNVLAFVFTDFSIGTVLVNFFYPIQSLLLIYTVMLMEKKKKSFGFCVYSIYQYLFIFLLLVFVFTGVFHLYSIGYFFFYITIVVNLYSTAHGKKNERIVFGFCVYSIHQYLFFFAFGFCVYWCF